MRRRRAFCTGGRMRPVQKSLCALMVLTASLAFLYLHVWSPKPYSTVDLRRGPARMPEQLLNSHILVPEKKYAHIAFRIKEEILELLPKNSCKCEVEPSIMLPFQKQLFGHVYSIEFANAFTPSELPKINSKREQEYRSYQQRSCPLPQTEQVEKNPWTSRCPIYIHEDCINIGV